MSGDNPFEVSSDGYGDRSGYDRGVVTAEVSTRTIELLNQTRPWVSLIGILAWIGTALLVFVILGSAGMALAAGQPGMMLSAGVYLIMALIYGYIAKSLTGYARRISRLNVSERVEDLEDALESQKNFWNLHSLHCLAGHVWWLCSWQKAKAHCNERSHAREGPLSLGHMSNGCKWSLSSQFCGH